MWKPSVATVLDWEQIEQLSEVLSWADEAAKWVETVVIIPKVYNGVRLIPRMIAGKPVRLGYSVPTKFAGTNLFLSEFLGWQVHWLGGSPKVQIEISRYLDVASLDGNAIIKAAQYGNYWDGQQWRGIGKCDDMPYKAFAKSCENIIKMWTSPPPHRRWVRTAARHE